MAATTALTVAVALCCCTPVKELNTLAYGDVQPPRFVGATLTDARTVAVELSEPAVLQAEHSYLEPSLGLEVPTEPATTLALRLEEGTVPGKAYRIHGVAEDAAGNTLTFVTEVYGYNPELPQVRINELTTQGSSRHPDMVELRVLDGGNMGGIALYAGVCGDYDGRIVFPPLRVERDDYIVAHFKPEQIEAEIDERRDKAESGGLDASDGAWDFWVPGGEGITGNNGVVTLYRHPGGPLMDAVCYSNRTSDSDERYRGFGSRETLERMEAVVAAGGWISERERIRPEDTVNPEESTATRSINRDAAATDTDTKTDWHIVPTSGASFGSANSMERHDPG